MTEQTESKNSQIQEETITSVTEDIKSKEVEKVETSDNSENLESQTNGHKEEKEGTNEEGKVENVSSTEESGEAKSGDSEQKEENEAENKKTEDQATKKEPTLSSTVAQHYNEIPAGTKELRKDSRIFYLRNFNNWVKSVIINEFMEKIKRRKRTSDDINVLDLACGKGGDLIKWDKAKVDHVILADIAATSIEQCKERYAKMLKDRRSGRYKDRLYSAEYFAADCTKEILSEKYKKKDIKLDLTSCQFAYHYSFESYEQADVMLKNACENLRVGGYFVGTTPDANKLVKRIKESKADSFGNSVFNIKPENRDQFPLFGSKYMFYLEGVVNCPEFLVHMPTLEALAAKYNMKLVWKKNFHEIFKEYQRQHSSLLNKMNALEQYPAPSGKTLAGVSESQYKAACDYIDKKGCKQAGTLSADEWEVAGLYIAFAFEKIDPSRENKERDSRKRQRDRSHDRQSHGDRRHSSSSKRVKKETEEVYEVKDEFYEPEFEESAVTSTGKEKETVESEKDSSEKKADDTTTSEDATTSEVTSTETTDVPAKEEPTEEQQTEAPVNEEPMEEQSTDTTTSAPVEEEPMDEQESDVTAE